MKKILAGLFIACPLAIFAQPSHGSAPPSTSTQKSDSLIFTNEKHLRNVKQLTFRGENAEAYLSFDEKKLIFQSHNDENDCDQIYTMNLDGSNRQLVSTGKGRTTCSYYLPNGKIIYASTHLGNEKCPAVPDPSQGYVWPLYSDYDIFIADENGKNPKKLIAGDTYDAEATVSPTGDKIIFTSLRTGDIELFSSDLDGKNVKQLTDKPGYDGGAFFSFDGKKIVFRASRPEGKDLESYKDLLSKGLIRPSKLEIYVMNADGTEMKQVTNFGCASFAPFFHPDGKRIIFSTNYPNPRGRNFDLYMINIDGTGLERLTFFEGFDGFPMFTKDGKKLVFCSNRNNAKPGDTNVFVADWID